MAISEIIQKNYGKLTKKQRQIADYLLEKPMEVCYISLSDLSRRTGCSELTVLKFCKSLGFSGFLQLKQAFRSYHDQLDVPFDASFSLPDGLSDNSDFPFLQHQRESQKRIIDQFYARLDLEEVSAIAQALSGKRILYIFAHDVSRIFASYLKLRLITMKFTTVQVDLSDMRQVENAFRNIDHKDAAIFFSFPNYFFSMENVARMAAEKCGTIILFTNQRNSPAAPYASHTVICETDTDFFHNFWCTPVAYISLLTDCLLRHLPSGQAQSGQQASAPPDAIDLL